MRRKGKKPGEKGEGSARRAVHFLDWGKRKEERKR